MRRELIAGIVVVAILTVAAVVLNHDSEEGKEDEIAAGPRPERWAKPMDLSGAPNFFKVSDDLYRGAQPEKEGFREIGQLGVATVVNLRSFHSDRDDLEGTGLAYEHIWMKAWHPEDHEIVRFLEIVSDPEKTPVFVHCQHGADRTGTMCVIYRIVVEGWTKEDAIREMTEGGYGFHTVWDNLIEYIGELDVEGFRKDANLPVTPTGEN